MLLSKAERRPFGDDDVDDTIWRNFIRNSKRTLIASMACEFSVVQASAFTILRALSRSSVNSSTSTSSSNDSDAVFVETSSSYVINIATPSSLPRRYSPSVIPAE